MKLRSILNFPNCPVDTIVKMDSLRLFTLLPIISKENLTTTLPGLRKKKRIKGINKDFLIAPYFKVYDRVVISLDLEKIAGKLKSRRFSQNQNKLKQNLLKPFHIDFWQSVNFLHLLSKKICKLF